MRSQIDCGLFEAYWNPITQDYYSVTFRSPNSDITSVTLTTKSGDRETTFCLSYSDSNDEIVLRRSSSSQFPDDRDIPEASRYLEEL
ncbi:hypothetical protein HYW75_04300 [Candidatus Pacearchaeota archaeon]|nr:hypothetical protein [Candidatus Pacearchaeota archaeon]